MKITVVCEREIEAVSLRSAWLMSRAWRPGWQSPISPSISARGVSAATHQRIRDFESLLAGIWLRNQKILEIDPKLARVDRIERVLGVDEGADAALFLGLGDDMQGQGGLAGRFRPINLDDPAAREAADPQGDIEPKRTGRHRIDLDHFLVFSEPHDRAFSKSSFNLRQSGVERLGLIHGRPFHETEVCW